MLERKRKLAEELLARASRPEGAAAARAAAEARLREMGGPARRDEYWRFTDPAALIDAPGGAGGEAALGDVEAVEIHFENGRLVGELPRIDGLEIVPLSSILAGEGDPLFGALEAAGQEKVARPFAALNTARAAEGLAFRARGVVETPVHVRMTGESAPLRHLARVESGASLTLVETGFAADTTMEVDVEKAGAFEHVRVQTGARPPAVTHVFARVAAEARFKTFTLTSDGALTRNEVVFELVGDDAAAHAAGAVLGRGESHVDNTVFVTHSALNGESRQVYKNVLDERARVVFQGKIFVREGAQKTDGYQISQSILLSDRARFIAKPELEIYADDVLCSHGSTTGSIDEEALFYLRARGVPLKQAEALLVAAFVDEAIVEIDHEGLADAMRGLVAEWMATR